MDNTTANQSRAHKITARYKLAALALVLTLANLHMPLPAAAQTADNPWMQTQGRTSQPVGHYDFCKKNKNECNIISNQQKPLTLTQPVWELIVRINAQVNQAVEPRTDMQIWGQEEVWSYPVQSQGRLSGDCEDYVLLKRRMLINAGLAANTLLITVVRQHNGEGHAVLTLRTDRGDFILDNLENTIKPWHQTAYSFIKRQSALHSGQWVDIHHRPQMLMSAVATSALGH